MMNVDIQNFFGEDVFQKIYADKKHTLAEYLHDPTGPTDSLKNVVACNIICALLVEPQLNVFVFHELVVQKLLRRLFDQHDVALVHGCWLAKNDSARLLDCKERDTQFMADILLATIQLTYDFGIPSTALECSRDGVYHILVVFAAAAGRNHRFAADMIDALCATCGDSYNTRCELTEAVWEMAPIASVAPRRHPTHTRNRLYSYMSAYMGEGKGAAPPPMPSNQQALRLHAMHRRSYHKRVLETRRRAYAKLTQAAAMQLELVQQRELDAREECCICLDAVSTLEFVPCGHLATCRDCGASLETCPLCRAEIKCVKYHSDQITAVPPVPSAPARRSQGNRKKKNKHNKKKKCKRKNKF